MKLTVAIPSYNKENYIERCLDSVLREKEYIDEIVLVDNYSNDKTFELAKKYEPHIKCYQNSSNIGSARNWNRCIDLCKTDLLMILHADDELLPGAIKRYLDFFEKYPDVGLVYADCFYTKEGDLKNMRYSKTDKKTIRKAGVEAIDMPSITCSTVVVKKLVYDNLGYFLESTMGILDWEMWRRIGSRYNTGYMDVPTAIYNVNSASTGPSLLRTVPLREIESGWKDLSDIIISYYPLSMREFKKKDTRKGMIDGFIAVFVANLKASQYKRALASMYFILFRYKGFYRVMVRMADSVMGRMGEYTRNKLKNI